MLALLNRDVVLPDNQMSAHAEVHILEATVSYCLRWMCSPILIPALTSPPGLSRTTVALTGVATARNLTSSLGKISPMTNIVDCCGVIGLNDDAGCIGCSRCQQQAGV